MERPKLPLGVWIVGPPELVGPFIEHLQKLDAEGFDLTYGRPEKSLNGELLQARWLIGRKFGPMPDEDEYRLTQMQVDAAAAEGKRLLKSIYIKAAKENKASGVVQASLFSEAPRAGRKGGKRG